jgi:hypothetical protein
VSENDPPVIETVGPPWSAQRSALVGRLTVVGWLLLGAQFGFIGFQLERVRSIDGDGTRFASAWDRRVEVLSFLVLPPNITVLAPAALVATGATILAGRDPDPWLAALLRIVAGIAITFFFLGVAAIAEIATREGQGGDLDQVFMRAGGMSFAAGVAVLSHFADTLSKQARV